MNNHTNFCSNLYVWLYFEIKKSRISNDIVKEIFELPMSRENEGHNYCVYDSFNDEINNPENLIKLGIFNYNVDTFQSMLKHSEKSKDCYLKKYVYECVDIYYKIKNAYNFPFPCNSIQQKNACDIINVFNMLYTSKISKGKGIIHTFPELSPDAPLNYTDVCPVEETESTPITGFTPVGKFFRFGNKNNTIITSNFDKNMENELFHAINKDSNIKDIPPKYNIGYEPI
ncbi:hypothetical protein PVBG_04819 [Plasmodium vivax Brazil I]|uniref:VIR protein n=1 Tax=Plasmodium vivax (strain Brazil I) TaxID=1033975 RepID=A0A0J9SZM9_PLAV1|nr:hypothetical protein PVBG_04819 [Plasmodium vivax Brazil I]